MRKILFLIVVVLCFGNIVAFKPENKLLRKAMRQLEKGNLKEAKLTYKQAVEKYPTSFKANLGMGLLLSELLANYTEAQPFLEKAYTISSKDTVPALIYALAKCYQHNGEFEKALEYFNSLDGYTDPDDEIDVMKDIQKRKGDCNYAIRNRSNPLSKDLYIVNAGSNVNSDMPEYVPVLTPKNELIFTSRRKDDSNEQLSYLDGKYFESMYISKIENSGMQTPRRYTLPDHFSRSKFKKQHESVVSMSPDGSILFTFHDNKIYEIKMNETETKKPTKLLKTVNYDYYQNHAFLTKDGKSLYFTSEGKGGKGGLDIYKAVRGSDGQWGTPENIGSDINTEFDEDAPFVTDDGNTLYFASNGHQGFGNFDIYKCKWIDGKWSKPENLGQPVNSPGHDIFLVLDGSEANGYFSSSRSGGYGDMDIYKINYLTNLKQDCTPGTNVLSLKIEDTDASDFSNTVKANVSEHYKVLASEWKINENKVTSELFSLTNDYKKKGKYNVSAKFIVYCDTCFAPIVACSSIENIFERNDVVIVPPSNSDVVDLKNMKGELTKDQLKTLGFDTRAILFDFDSSNLKDEANSILKTNVIVMKKYPSLHVEITGYTDAKGTEAHNRKLSAKRAKKVMRYLRTEGIDEKQILLSTGKGASDPVVNCESKQCNDEEMQQNRRVEFKVFNK